MMNKPKITNNDTYTSTNDERSKGIRLRGILSKAKNLYTPRKGLVTSS